MVPSSVRQSLGQLPALRRTVVSHYAVPHVRVARIQAGAPGMQTSGCVRRSAGGKNNAKSNNLSDYVPDAEPQAVIDLAVRQGNIAIFLFWVLWIVLTGGAVYGFCVLENRWLD